MTRNRWRGILRFGLINALKLKHELKHNTQSPEVHLAVCAIAKNEGPYFTEWIEWHRRQGVERFYIYDNESTDGTQALLKPYIEQGIVVYQPWPGYRRQLAAYDHCLAHHRYEARWIAFIDLDEYDHFHYEGNEEAVVEDDLSDAEDMSNVTESEGEGSEEAAGAIDTN